MKSARMSEKILFDLVSQESSPSTVFIIGSPRTGSTILYQLLINSFSFPYISNFVNDYYAETPIVGLAIQHGINIDIDMKNSFGKTEGVFQPSEGSTVISNWFGGRHPSQKFSKNILEGQEAHFINTLGAVELLYGGVPLLIKNAWNCFRVKYLATVLKSARFIWIRRDIADAAESDLDARYFTKGSGSIWNSATPSNWKELIQLKPYQQVVENQFEFNQAIADALKKYASNRFIEIWYEDLVSSTQCEIRRVSEFTNLPLKTQLLPLLQKKGPSQRIISKQDTENIFLYLNIHEERFIGFRYKQKESGS